MSYPKPGSDSGVIGCAKCWACAIGGGEAAG